MILFWCFIWLPVTSPQKLRHMVPLTSPHFEKMRGNNYGDRCRKVCWGVGEVRRDVGKDEEMWGTVFPPE